MKLLIPCLMALAYTPLATARTPLPLATEDAGGPADHTLWRFGKWNINLKQQFGLAGLQQGSYAVATFTSGDLLHDKLRSDHRVLFIKENADGDSGFALLDLTETASLTDLAQAAHGGPGFGCGRLQLLQPRFLQETTVTEPVYSPRVFLDEVQDLLASTDHTTFSDDVGTLVGLGSRYHTSGNNASLQTYNLFAEAGASHPDFSLQYIEHAKTPQKSVIAALAGSEDDATTVIFGAHLDSISPNLANAPGADDDASGIAALAEVIRTIAANGVRFKRRLEFHGYAAEEVGLVGSGEIAGSYQDAGKKVAAMFQLDMVGYASNPSAKTIYLVKNNTTNALRRSLKDLISLYLNGDFAEKTLTAGTSDHASWWGLGFPTVFPFEDPTDYSPYIHTTNDTLANLNNPELAGRFVKLALAFASYHGGLVNAAASYQNQEGEIFANELSHDLKLATIANSKKTGHHSFAVATTPAAESVEYCRIDEGASSHCQGEIYSLSQLGSQGGRKVFYDESQSLALADAEKFRFFAYDGQNQLVAVRHVNLTRR